MRIATWNVQRPTSGRKRARQQEWLDRINADIWVLTETHEALQPSPRHQSVVTTESDPSQQHGEAWVAIWSRYPIRALESTSDPGRAVAAMVSLPTGELLVYGTVLPWLGSAWGQPASTTAAFVRALEAQRADWLQRRDQHPSAEMCVAGDLNQDLASRHYYGSSTNRDALNASLRDAGLHGVTGGSDDPVFAQSGGSHASIDHIALSSHLSERVEQRGCWPEAASALPELSDHFGVFVDISV